MLRFIAVDANFRNWSYCSFLNYKQNKIVTCHSRGVPISIAVLHFRVKVKSDENLNNCMNICILESTRSCNVLTNQLWLLLFSILLSSLTVLLLHASSLWLTSLFSTSWQSLKASSGSYSKKYFLKWWGFYRYYYYFSISRARSTCVLHVVFFFIFVVQL